MYTYNIMYIHKDEYKKAIGRDLTREEVIFLKVFVLKGLLFLFLRGYVQGTVIVQWVFAIEPSKHANGVLLVSFRNRTVSMVTLLRFIRRLDWSNISRVVFISLFNAT